jgi:hypothetical protein
VPVRGLPPPSGTAPLELVIERLDLHVRMTWAFHAREIRFERKEASGWVALFPETFSFHLDRHDPTELSLQLEDLWSDPRRLAPFATKREAQELLRSLLAAAPGYLERVLDELERSGRLVGAVSQRVHADAVVLAVMIARFVREKQLDEHPEARFTRLHLRKLVWRASCALVRERVSPGALEAFMDGTLPGVHDPSERAFLAALAGDPDAEGDLEPMLLAIAERAFQRWLEDTCLDTDNQAFDGEDSPFGRREDEVLAVVSIDPAHRLRRARHFSPFLRRRGSRDCQRILRKLEVWLLRQYDVPRAAAVIHLAENLGRGRGRPDGILSWHSTSNYLGAIALLVWPFVGAAFLYQRATLFFDAVVSLETAAVIATALWYLLYRFVWQRDLSFFHGAVPRIGAGIIVGYMPVFLIDEVWDLSRRPWFPLGVTVLLLATTTLLYIYVEVRRRIDDPDEAFARALRLFLLGVVEALALGLVVTTLLGAFMVVRVWGSDNPAETVETVRLVTPPFIGQLPRIMGVAPVYAYPTAVLLMTFFSFFIGTFLQLLWEDLPITEPL